MRKKPVHDIRPAVTARGKQLGKLEQKTGDLVNIELDHRTQAIVTTVERILAERETTALPNQGL